MVRYLCFRVLEKVGEKLGKTADFTHLAAICGYQQMGISLDQRTYGKSMKIHKFPAEMNYTDDGFSMIFHSYVVRHRVP